MTAALNGYLRRLALRSLLFAVGLTLLSFGLGLTDYSRLRAGRGVVFSIDTHCRCVFTEYLGFGYRIRSYGGVYRVKPKPTETDTLQTPGIVLSVLGVFTFRSELTQRSEQRMEAIELPNMPLQLAGAARNGLRRFERSRSRGARS